MSDNSDRYVVASKQAKDKNRYVNVLPNNTHRVRLSPIDGVEASDYINASHCRVPLRGVKFRYIAAQAPPAPAFNDWWRMVWEQGVKLMLMITRLMEKGRVKASIYWPTLESQPEAFGDITVSLIRAAQPSAGLKVRTLQLQRGEETRIVQHLQFTAWPDHGVPNKFASFVELFTGKTTITQ
eukprot:TRINITY_DN66088_c5_g1_i2.p1 TRINITY_DN66088_c5_g1~~TRINITY_DN66088_c5_g1_i2.p1  ORF type:complete len:182 (-),score=79.91 TRINITY_DN66088_c5_g1_i2:101-646(-)